MKASVTFSSDNKKFKRTPKSDKVLSDKTKNFRKTEVFSMVKSIQYFNEKSVPIFEKLEDEFLRDPSDIASYVTKLTEELHKAGIRMIEETLSYLDEMINESEARKLSWVVDRHETKQLITSLGSVNYQ